MLCYDVRWRARCLAMRRGGVCVGLGWILFEFAYVMKVEVGEGGVAEPSGGAV